MGTSRKAIAILAAKNNVRSSMNGPVFTDDSSGLPPRHSRERGNPEAQIIIGNKFWPDLPRLDSRVRGNDEVTPR